MEGTHLFESRLRDVADTCDRLLNHDVPLLDYDVVEMEWPAGSAGVQITVPHRLGRVPKYYIVLRLEDLTTAGANHVYPPYHSPTLDYPMWDDTQIVLRTPSLYEGRATLLLC